MTAKKEEEDCWWQRKCWWESLGIADYDELPRSRRGGYPDFLRYVITETSKFPKHRDAKRARSLAKGCLDEVGTGIEQQQNAIDLERLWHGSQTATVLEVYLEELDRRCTGSSEGGRKRAAPLWHAQCVSLAEKLIADGCERHNLVAKCRKKFPDHSDDRIRAVLQIAGLVTKKNRMK